MIIPIRCFTCGKVLADKWRAYERRCAELSTSSKMDGGDGTQQQQQQTQQLLMDAPRGKIMDELGLTRMCCRRHILTHVDLHDHA